MFNSQKCAAADIFLSENQVERDKASINERIIAAEEYAEALDCHEGSNQNQVQTRLENMELELTTALQFLRSKKEGYIAKEVSTPDFCHSLVYASFYLDLLNA